MAVLQGFLFTALVAVVISTSATMASFGTTCQSGMSHIKSGKVSWCDDVCLVSAEGDCLLNLCSALTITCTADSPETFMEAISETVLQSYGIVSVDNSDVTGKVLFHLLDEFIDSEGKSNLKNTKTAMSNLQMSGTGLLGKQAKEVVEFVDQVLDDPTLAGQDIIRLSEDQLHKTDLPRDNRGLFSDFGTAFGDWLDEKVTVTKTQVSQLKEELSKTVESITDTAKTAVSDTKDLIINALDNINDIVNEDRKKRHVMVRDVAAATSEKRGALWDKIKAVGAEVRKQYQEKVDKAKAKVASALKSVADWLES